MAIELNARRVLDATLQDVRLHALEAYYHHLSEHGSIEDALDACSVSQVRPPTAAMERAPLRVPGTAGRNISVRDQVAPPVRLRLPKPKLMPVNPAQKAARPAAY